MWRTFKEGRRLTPRAATGPVRRRGRTRPGFRDACGRRWWPRRRSWGCNWRGWGWWRWRWRTRTKRWSASAPSGPPPLHWPRSTPPAGRPPAAATLSSERRKQRRTNKQANAQLLVWLRDAALESVSPFLRVCVCETWRMLDLLEQATVLLCEHWANTKHTCPTLTMWAPPVMTIMKRLYQS